MKKLLIAFMLPALAGCHTPDEDILADIACKAQKDLNFAGLHYTVQNGMVNFRGTCPSEKAFAKIKQTVTNIHVIKGVHYSITIAPVSLNALTPVKQQADSLLAQYPRVTAAVDSTSIILKGDVTALQRETMIKAFAKSHISPIKDSMTVR